MMDISESGRDNIPPDPIDCATCRDRIPAYVQQELANALVDQLEPVVAVHIETCPKCEVEYYREFRHQGLRKPLQELQQVGHRASVAGVLEQILVSGHDEVASNWYEEAWRYGRAWLDRASAAWRQVEINFSRLGASPETAPAWALAGLQGSEEPLATEGVPLITIEEAHFELRIQVAPETDAPEKDLCRLDIAVTLFDRFGDYSGVVITLLYDGVAQVATTDALGRVHFEHVPRVQLQAMRLLVRLLE